MNFQHGQIAKILVFALLAVIVFSNKASAQTDSTAKDSALLKQIELQMQANTPAPVAPQQTRSGISSNPDIGVVADFRASYISQGKKNFDAYLNETELSFQSVVDPYIRADFFVSFGRDPDTHKYGVEVEEGVLGEGGEVSEVLGGGEEREWRELSCQKQQAN